MALEEEKGRSKKGYNVKNVRDRYLRGRVKQAHFFRTLLHDFYAVDRVGAEETWEHHVKALWLIWPGKRRSQY